MLSGTCGDEERHAKPTVGVYPKEKGIGWNRCLSEGERKKAGRQAKEHKRIVVCRPCEVPNTS